MNVDEVVKNECIKVYNKANKKMLLLNPLINKMKENKNNVDSKDILEIKKLMEMIHLQCFNLSMILRDYEHLDRSIKELHQFNKSNKERNENKSKEQN